jgi:hypothetical protein
LFLAPTIPLAKAQSSPRLLAAAHKSSDAILLLAAVAASVRRQELA